MSIITPLGRDRLGRVREALRPAPVTWPTVLLLAVLLAYGDGFVLTSIEGAVGAPGRVQDPFIRWLWTSTLMLPVFVLAVLLALAFARKRMGPALRTTRKVLAAGLLIAVAGALVGTAHTAVALTYDYHVQAEQNQAIAAAHTHATGAPAAGPADCHGSCSALQDQLVVDLRAVRLGSGIDLGINIILVCWALAARGGHLEPRRRPALRPV